MVIVYLVGQKEEEILFYGNLSITGTTTFFASLSL